MAKFTPYGVTALPTTGIDTAGLYFRKLAADNFFTLHVRNNANSDWLTLGIVNAVNSVNDLIGDVQLDLAFSNGVLSITGSAVTFDLDARYRKLGDDIPWAEISGAPDFALDSQVVHNSLLGANNGVATLDGSGKVPAAQLPSFVEDVLEYPALSDFPATGDTGVIYVAQDTEKTYRWSGTAYIEISPSDVNGVFGRTGNVSALGADYAAFYLRYDVSQSLNSSQKTQARQNIGAADDSGVLHKTGAETKAGILTLTSSPVVPNASNANQAAAFGQIGAAVDAAEYVSYANASQGLTVQEKLNARTNIDVPASEDLNWGQKDW